MAIDALIRIKNAQAVKKDIIKIPYSRIIFDTLGVMAKNGFLDSVAKKGRGIKRYLEVKLKYENNEGTIKSIKLISKPSIRYYSGYKDLRKIRSGYGLGIISTSQGIMTYQDARKKHLGGERICEIW